MRAKCFSCGGLRISICNFRSKKIKKVHSCTFFTIFGYKNPGLGTGSGSAIRKNYKSGSALNQCGSTTLVEGIHCKKLTFLSRRPIRLQAPPPPRHPVQLNGIPFSLFFYWPFSLCVAGTVRFACSSLRETHRTLVRIWFLAVLSIRVCLTTVSDSAF